jgi:tetratricopeptide (TPR) repeat protein
MSRLGFFWSLIAVALVAMPAMADASLGAMYVEGTDLDRQGKTREAYGIAEQMIGSAPSDSMGYKLRAELNYKHGKTELAKQDATKCMDLINVQVSQMSLHTGAAHSPLRAPTNDAAPAQHASWQDLSPNGALAIGKSGPIDTLESDMKNALRLAKAGNWQGALTSINSAIKSGMDPGLNAAALEQRSEIYQHLDQPENALADMKQYQELQKQHTKTFISNYHEQAVKDSANGTPDLRSRARDFLDNKTK